MFILREKSDSDLNPFNVLENPELYLSFVIQNLSNGID